MNNDCISCTWKDKAECAGCKNEGRLNCRWNASDLLLFTMTVMPAMLGCLAGTILIWIFQGIWWPTIVYVLFFPIGLGVAETRFLCSHCPYYAQEGRVLHCLANHGVLKIWRYHPEPMSRIEKKMMILTVIIFLLAFPGGVLGYDIWFFFANLTRYGEAALTAVIALVVVTISAVVAFGFVMVKHICAACVNFSCPFNRVDKKYRDAYLRKNPVMRKAWEESGYRIDSES